MVTRMLCVLLLTASCWGQEPATWKMIRAKSHCSSGPLATAMTARYEGRSGAEIWTFYRMRADGTSETTSQTLRFDGKEYPCGDLGLQGMPDTVISRKLDCPDSRGVLQESRKGRTAGGAHEIGRASCRERVRM